jgi:hypothetical protein
MRVISQLIDFFRRHGALDEQQLACLARGGFYDPFAEFYDEYYSDRDDEYEVLEESEFDQTADSFELPRRRGRGHARYRGRRVRGKELCERIRTRSMT